MADIIPNYNRSSKEKIEDIAPKVIPELKKGVSLEGDKNYEEEIYSKEQLEFHDKAKINVFTADNIPSRWGHNQLRSTWHFDKNRDPDSETTFVIPCRFTNDLSEVVDYCLKNQSAEVETVGNYRPRDKSRQDHDLHDAELMDVKRATGENDLIVFKKILLVNRKFNDKGEFKKIVNPDPMFDIFYKMMDYLGVDVHMSRLHIQRLGQVTPMHIDQQMRYARDGWKQIWQEAGADKNPLKLRRFLIMLQDWDYGHAWLFGNKYFQQYKSGTAVTYDWCNMPHGTANFGYNPRLTLQFTGFISEKTQYLIDNPDPNREVYL
jgi:hypothetical protein